MIKFLKEHYIYIIIFLISLSYSLIIINSNKESYYSGNETTFLGKIKNFDYDGNKIVLTLQDKEKIICTYYLKTLNEKNKLISILNIGDTVKIKGILKRPKNNTIPNTFNYKKFLSDNKIYWTMNINNIKKISNNQNPFTNIKIVITKRISNYKYTSNYLYAFILGDISKIDDEILESYSSNGISHLFAISGMHLSLIMGFLSILLRKINNKIRLIIIMLILLFYLFLTDYSPSLLRASTFTFLILINKYLKLNIKRENILFCAISLIVIINPYIITNIGFQYSCIISLFLIINLDKIKYKNYFMKSIKISFIAFMAGLPITLCNFYEINFISILLNLIFVPLISILIFPFSIITFFFPIFNPILNIFIILLENLSLFFSKIDVFKIIFCKSNLFVYLLYYLIIILIFKNFNFILLLSFVLLIHTNYQYFNTNSYMIAFDVGQGDSLLIVLPNNSGNIMIDTGGSIKYEVEQWKKQKNEYSISKSKLTTYLKSVGIKKIDYLILTHGDFDHMGEAVNMINSFKIKNVIFNKGEYNKLELELINILKKLNIPYYHNLKELNINNNKFYFLNNELYDDENDNSSVIYTELNSTKLLLMGDAGIKVEEDMLKKYKLNNIDILKVGHHGSKTSSNKNFINYINPKFSIISVGENNTYNHPNNDVLNNLKYSKIYRTDKEGSIIFNFKRNKLKVETYVP